MMKNRMMNHF